MTSGILASSGLLTAGWFISCMAWLLICDLEESTMLCYIGERFGGSTSGNLTSSGGWFPS